MVKNLVFRFTLYSAALLAAPISTFAQASSEGRVPAFLPDCPPQIRVLNEPPGDPFDCLCTQEIQKARGTVHLFGSGPYESSTNICIAAVHAGVAPKEGGPVRVIPRPPQSKFVGTLANGFFSEDYGLSKFNTFDVAPVEN